MSKSRFKVGYEISRGVRTVPGELEVATTVKKNKIKIAVAGGIDGIDDNEFQAISDKLDAMAADFNGKASTPEEQVKLLQAISGYCQMVAQMITN